MQFKPVLFKSRTFRKASSLITDIITSTSYILGLFWDGAPPPPQASPEISIPCILNWES